jgi:hypothetical protein
LAAFLPGACDSYNVSLKEFFSGPADEGRTGDGGKAAVSVKVPSTALSAYGPVPTNTTENNWGNAFRGRGWDGTAYLTGTVNSKITLTFDTY